MLRFRPEAIEEYIKKQEIEPGNPGEEHTEDGKEAA
jgi:hypothetical protein